MPNVPTNCSTIWLGASPMRRITGTNNARQDEAEHDAAGDRDQKRRREAPAVGPVRHEGRHREAIDQQRARVVEQALAFENDDEAMGQAQRPEDGRGGRRIGRRDDRAERDRRGPGNARHHRVHERRDGAVVITTAITTSETTGIQLARRSRSEVSNAASSRTGATKSARASDGIEPEVRRVVHQRERRAAERQQRRIRRADAAGDRGQRHRAGQQDQRPLEDDHEPIVGRAEVRAIFKCLISNTSLPGSL